MAIDANTLLKWPFPDIKHEYSTRDTILYALGVGLGRDPLDTQQLRFLYEEGLLALPTMPVVLGSPGFWVKNPKTGVDWKSVLHGEQGLQIHKPLPTSGTVIGKTVIEEVVDKGAGKGALLYSRRDLINQADGELLASINSTSFLRGDGGFGGPAASKKPRTLPQIPTSPPDLVDQLKTLPQAALIYRLSGDYNPLHADPAVAASVGFKQPILHGLCSYAIAGYAALKNLCGFDATRLRRFDLRFSSPVYPGETISTEIWRQGKTDAGLNRAVFRSRVLERDTVVLNNGLIEYAN